MMKYVFAFLMLLPLSVFADDGVLDWYESAASNCESSTAAISASGESSYVDVTQDSVGQSFTVTETMTLHSIDVKISAFGSSVSLPVRIGTSFDLSTSYIEEMIMTPTGTGEYKIMSALNPVLTPGVYMFVVAGGSGSYYLSAEKTNGSLYSGGSVQKQPVLGTFNVTEARDWDLFFRVNECGN